MKRVLITVAFVFAAGAQSFAADLPQPPPPPPPQAPAAYVPMTAPVYNWGGVYFGVTGGAGFGHSEWIGPSGISTGNFNVSGALVAGTIGANIQAEAFVFGVDADFGPAWLDGKTSVCSPVKCETKDAWLSTARARVGYAADRVLIYGTAGAAFGDIQANTFGTKFQHTNKPGWAAGGGIETAFGSNWTARVEYLFVQLQDASLPAVGGGSDIVKLDANILRVGLDYKFR